MVLHLKYHKRIFCQKSSNVLDLSINSHVMIHKSQNLNSKYIKDTTND